MHVLVVASAVVIALFNYAGAQEQTRYNVPFIKVYASKSAEFAPDLANINVGVTTEKKTASEAAAENAKTSQAVIEQIKGLGVEPRDIRTVSVSVSPVYNEDRDPSGRVTKRTVRGYVARNTVDIRIRQVDKAGQIARQLIDKGANQFGGIHFSLSDRQARLDELRAQALKEAAAKAKGYAEAMGVKLKRILEIDPDPSVRADGQADLPARAPPGAADVVIPVEVGVQSLFVTVGVVWEIAE